MAERQREPSIPQSAQPSTAQRSPTARGSDLTNAPPFPLGPRCRLGSIESEFLDRLPPLCGPYGFRPGETNGSASPASTRMKPTSASGSIEKSFRNPATARPGPVEKARETDVFALTVKKMTTTLQPRCVAAALYCRKKSLQMRLRLSRPRAIISAWISLVPSPIIISGASR